MRINSLLLLLFLSTNLLCAQDNPIILKVPNNLTYTFITNLETYKNTTTELYLGEIDGKETSIIKVTTDKIPDCIFFMKNHYGGGDIYKKLKDGEYIRIVECRKNGDSFGIYLVNNQNESNKFFSVSSINAMQALLNGYVIYWSNINPQNY